jgi:hypothetical protein
LDEFVRPGFLGVENLWSHHSKLDISRPRSADHLSL